MLAQRGTQTCAVEYTLRIVSGYPKFIPDQPVLPRMLAGLMEGRPGSLSAVLRSSDFCAALGFAATLAKPQTTPGAAPPWHE
jgi:hypothetical protein